MVILDHVGKNIALVNFVLICPGCQSYNEKNSNGQLTRGEPICPRIPSHAEENTKGNHVSNAKKIPSLYWIRNNIGENIKYASYKEPITSLLQKEPCSLAAGQGVGSRDRTI